MSVKSARVQKVVKGDDVVFRHQIMEDKAYNAEKVRAPVEVLSGDVVKVFYPIADGEDQIGYLASPVGPLPSSLIDVSIDGVIDPVDDVPQRGTISFQSGEARTVRVEIVRDLDGKKESHYLYEEVDVLERGFPDEPVDSLNLT